MRSLAGLIVLALVGAMVAYSRSSDDQITDRSWQLVELGGSPPLPGTEIDMNIEDDHISGSSGCNSYNGAAEVDGETLSLGPEFAVTFMACADDVMAQEQAYIEALNQATGYEIANDTLTLLDASGMALARFEQR
jgi:heat shock protein HslJ